VRKCAPHRPDSSSASDPKSRTLDPPKRFNASDPSTLRALNAARRHARSHTSALHCRMATMSHFSVELTGGNIVHPQCHTMDGLTLATVILSTDKVPADYRHESHLASPCQRECGLWPPGGRVERCRRGYMEALIAELQDGGFVHLLSTPPAPIDLDFRQFWPIGHDLGRKRHTRAQVWITGILC
jgi:hypothetical protein